MFYMRVEFWEEFEIMVWSFEGVDVFIFESLRRSALRDCGWARAFSKFGAT